MDSKNNSCHHKWWSPNYVLGSKYFRHIISFIQYYDIPTGHGVTGWIVSSKLICWTYKPPNWWNATVFGDRVFIGINKVSGSRSVVSYSLQCHELYSPWKSPGQSTGVGSPFFLQGIFPTQGPRSPALWADSLPAEPQGKPKNTGVGNL